MEATTNNLKSRLKNLSQNSSNFAIIKKCFGNRTLNKDSLPNYEVTFDTKNNLITFTLNERNQHKIIQTGEINIVDKLLNSKSKINSTTIKNGYNIKSFSYDYSDELMQKIADIRNFVLSNPNKNIIITEPVKNTKKTEVKPEIYAVLADKFITKTNQIDENGYCIYDLGKFSNATLKKIIELASSSLPDCKITTEVTRIKTLKEVFISGASFDEYYNKYHKNKLSEKTIQK